MPRFLIAASAIISMGAAAPAVADDRFPPIANEVVRSECGECHIAYQPQMLPQRSWRKLVDGLPNHFDEELSLDEARKFLRGLGSGDTPIRITDTPRWKDKHHELPKSVWSDPRLASKGDCAVCHTEAARGLYDDDDGLRVPGPNESWRRWEDD